MPDKATDPHSHDIEVSLKIKFHTFPLPFLPSISTFPPAYDTNIKNLLANLLGNQMIDPKCCYQIALGVLPLLLFLQLPILTWEFSHQCCCFSLSQRPPNHLKIKQKPSKSVVDVTELHKHVHLLPIIWCWLQAWRTKKKCSRIVWDEFSLPIILGNHCGIMSSWITETTTHTSVSDV